MLPAERLGPALGDGGALVDRVVGEVVAPLGDDRLGRPDDGRDNWHEARVALQIGMEI